PNASEFVPLYALPHWFTELELSFHSLAHCGCAVGVDDEECVCVRISGCGLEANRVADGLTESPRVTGSAPKFNPKSESDKSETPALSAAWTGNVSARVKGVCGDDTRTDCSKLAGCWCTLEEDEEGDE
ncbi:hypothetical protein OXX80_013565, partial [Metschnikowia pulcherrima]